MGCNSSKPTGRRRSSSAVQPPFEITPFLFSHSKSRNLDLSNKRCSDLDLEARLIPALSPKNADKAPTMLVQLDNSR